MTHNPADWERTPKRAARVDQQLARRVPFFQHPTASSYIATCAEAKLDPAWDAQVEATPFGELTQTTAWAATRQRLGHRFCHLRLHTTGGRPVGGCIMQIRQILPGVCVSAVPRGPLVFTEEPSAAEHTIRGMVAAARSLGARLLVVQPPEGSSQVPHAMAAAGFRACDLSIAPEATIRVDLRRREEDILRKVHESRRRRIRSAGQHGLETRSGDEVETFHRLHLATAMRQRFRPTSLTNLRAQWEILAPLGKCRIYITRYNGVPLAGEWVTFFAGTATSRFTGHDLSCDSRAARNAPSALIWACIRDARQNGAHAFDLGGFDRRCAEQIDAGGTLPAAFADTPSYFKWSFGGDVALLPQAQFLLTDPLSRLSLSGVAQRLLASDLVRRLAVRVRP
jgi:lipid II:glycine glycyltransferase (peptidoglycan interpeptide bridge formation enzyme)